MAYLIDANCFIEPFQRYYSFDICPGFWDWLDQQNQLGIVFSSEKVRGELLDLGDALSDWAKAKDDHFFLPVDSATLPNYGRIIASVRANKNYLQSAKDRFSEAKCADPFLIAHAMTYGHIIVTYELAHDDAKKIVPLPSVGNHFGAVCEPLHKVLRENGARFVLA